MKRTALFCFIAAVALFVLNGSGSAKEESRNAQTAPTSARGTGKATTDSGAQTPPRSSADESQALEIKRQQLVEREAALKAKEQELNNVAAKLDARIAELNAAQKAMEKSLIAKKKEENERYRRILKVYKALKPDEAGKLLNKLEDEMVIEMLNQMDQKTAVKLIPHLNQPNVLKWTRDNLKGK